MVAVIAVASGVLAAAAGASPTGSSIVDVVLVTATVAIVTWLAAAAKPVVAGTAALAAGAFSNSIWLAALGVATFAVAFWIGRTRWQSRIPSALLALVAMNIAARSSLDWFLGAPTVVAVVLAIVLALIGLRYRSRQTRLIVAVVCALYGVAALVGTAATALSGQDSLDELRQAEQSVDGALDLVLDGDTDGARQSLEAAITSLSDVESSLSSPLTMPATVVPVVAQHRRAAAEVSRSAQAAITLLESELDSLNLDAITAQPGTVDLDAVRALERPLEDFQPRSSTSPTPSTRSATRGWSPASTSDSTMSRPPSTSRQNGATSALEVVRAVPSLLGADSPRTYFVAFTTPTEIRALGGFMGNYAEVSADNGRIEVSDFGRHESLQNGARYIAGDIGDRRPGGLAEPLFAVRLRRAVVTAGHLTRHVAEHHPVARRCGNRPDHRPAVSEQRRSQCRRRLLRRHHHRHPAPRDHRSGRHVGRRDARRRQRRGVPDERPVCASAIARSVSICSTRCRAQ